MSERIKILNEGIELTSGVRKESYGELKDNLLCCARLYEVYKDYAGEKYPLEHDEGIRMLFHKVSRIACGGYHRDNYVDSAVYIAAAGECVVMKDE